MNKSYLYNQQLFLFYILRGNGDTICSLLYFSRIQRSSDRSRMTKRLTEEAEKYFEDFISNVEDTDISSFDGERSDGSSTLGGTTRARDITVGEAKSYQSPAGSSCPVEMEGVVLPWLQWVTSDDCSLSRKDKMQAPDTPETLLLDSKMVTFYL